MQLETGYRDAVLNLFDHEYGPRSAERRRLAIVRGLHDTGTYTVVICATTLLVWVLLENRWGFAQVFWLWLSSRCSPSFCDG